MGIVSKYEYLSRNSAFDNLVGHVDEKLTQELVHETRTLGNQ